MVEGLPLPAKPPWRPGVLFPPAALAIPGWVMWLALRGGEPAGCCATFDDSSPVGLTAWRSSPSRGGKASAAPSSRRSALSRHAELPDRHR